MSSSGRVPRHVLLVSYLFAPSSRSGARRAVALRDAMEELGVRVSVLTSTVSGRLPDDGARGVVRARDGRSLRGLQPVVGSPRRRWWSRLIVPDATVLSWAPAAATAAMRLFNHDRPDAVLTTSPPESVHLIGLELHARGVPWVADFRDGWTFEPPTLRPYPGRLDLALERLVVRRADVVTVVTQHLVDDLRARYGGHRIVELTNGFDLASPARSDGRPDPFDPARFSLVHTGTLGVNGKDPLPLLRALARLVQERPEVGEALEVVFVGPVTGDERGEMLAIAPAGTVKTVGEVGHDRAVELQREAEGLLLITPPRRERDAATTKVYEYLAAERPILALAEGSSAAVPLGSQHTVVPPDDEERILAGLREYVDRWVVRREAFTPNAGLEPFDFAQIARRLVDLFAEIGAFERVP